MRKYIIYTNKQERQKHQKHILKRKKWLLRLTQVIIVMIVAYILKIAADNNLHDRIQKCRFCSPSHIDIIGLTHISENAIIDKIYSLYPDITSKQIWLLDPWLIKKELLNTFHRIQNVDVRINLATREIIINLSEFRPSAIWMQDTARKYVVDHGGNILDDVILTEEEENIPILHGNSSNLHCNKIITFLQRNNISLSSISHLEFVGHRRWNVRFRNNTSLLLPQNLHDRQIKALRYLIAQTNITTTYDTIDLRLYPKKIFLRNNYHRYSKLTSYDTIQKWKAILG